MNVTLRMHLTSLAALLAGCPAYPVIPEAAESGSGSSSTGDADPPGGVPTGTDTDDVPGPDTTELTSTGASSGSVGVVVCGDGVVDPGEGCDDGAGNGPNAVCTNGCQLNVCGDGDVHAGVEACDEGADNIDTGYCRSNCQLGVCGDGYVFAALEACDAGEANGPDYGQCDANCTINRCGDGELDVGLEECDDGAQNGSDGDGEVAGCDLDCGFLGRRIFLSSQLFTGDMGTRAGADLACETMAYTAGLRHSYRYKALLADANGAPNEYIQHDPQDARPFILTTGLVLAASYSDLLASGPGDGVTTTELGEILYDKKVWTNVNPFGDAYLKESASTCASWNSANKLNSARVGYNAVAPGDAAALAEWRSKKQWLSFLTEPCSESFRIYCIEAS